MPTRLFSHVSKQETKRLTSFLRDETVGGALLVIAAVLAIICANVPGLNTAYADLLDFKVGPEALHLNLSLSTWAADGLLAIFFFVAGLELKREFVEGDLRDPKLAALPVAAACGGVLIPAAIYFAFNHQSPDLAHGWAIPTATDIAFALAILAIINNHLPTSLRTFLLTLAVVDDLIAIVIIAVFYTTDLHFAYFGLALIPLAIFGFMKQKHIKAPLVYIVLAFMCWTFMHASGIHATVAGVLLAFTVPVKGKNPDAESDAEHLEHILRPISAGVAVPIFAFMSAGVAIGSVAELITTVTHSASAAIIISLVIGKPLGIFGATWLVARFTHAELDPELKWLDVFGVSVLAGVGFTVSLLIGELAFGNNAEIEDNVKMAVLFGSILAGILAAIILKARDKHYRLVEEHENQELSA